MWISHWIKILHHFRIYKETKHSHIWLSIWQHPHYPRKLLFIDSNLTEVCSWCSRWNASSLLGTTHQFSRQDRCQKFPLSMKRCCGLTVALIQMQMAVMEKTEFHIWQNRSLAASKFNNNSSVHIYTHTLCKKRKYAVDILYTDQLELSFINCYNLDRSLATWLYMYVSRPEWLWRHNERNGVSNHRRLNRLLHPLFRFS